MATTFEDFMKNVNPSMLNASGRFAGPTSGANFMLEGMTPQEAFSTATTMQGPSQDDVGTATGGWQTQQKQIRDQMLNPAWREGYTGPSGFFGSVQNLGQGVLDNPALMAAAMAGGAQYAGVPGFTGESGVGGTTAGGGATGAANDFGMGTYGAGDVAATGGLAPLEAQTLAGTSAVTPVTAGTAATGVAGTGAAPAATGAVGASATTAASSPFMDTLKGILPGLAKGVVGGALNTALAPDPQKAIDAADPFSTQRAQYQPQLQQMMQGKFDATDPSYQWRFDQGTKAVNRGAAASGMLNSGNRLLALQQYGQGAASQEYQNQYNRLAQLSGANFGTGAAGSIAQQNAMGQQAGTNAVVGTTMDALGKLYGSWNSSTPAVNTTVDTFAPGGASFGSDIGYDNPLGW